jgi:hypothetical protein
VAGAGEVQELGTFDGNPQDISPDGKVVLMMRYGVGTYSMRLEGSEQNRTPKALIETAGELTARAGFSPDGRWVIYCVPSGSDKGIYVQPFPGPGLRTQIASIGGVPAWRKDGKEIVIASGPDVWSVTVETAGGRLRFGVLELLFSGLRAPAGSDVSTRPLAVSRDGSRIFWVQGAEQLGSNVINVRMGWESK